MNYETVLDVPPAIAKFYDKRHCPVCKSKLCSDSDGGLLVLRDKRAFNYVSYNNCSLYGEEYNIHIEYTPGKPVILDSEDIVLWSGDKEYHVANYYLENLTRITVYQLDESGTVMADEDMGNYEIKDQFPFNFKKYNEKKFLNLIKTLIIFN